MSKKKRERRLLPPMPCSHPACNTIIERGRATAIFSNGIEVYCNRCARRLRRQMRERLLLAARAGRWPECADLFETLDTLKCAVAHERLLTVRLRASEIFALLDATHGIRDYHSSTVWRATRELRMTLEAAAHGHRGRP